MELVVSTAVHNGRRRCNLYTPTTEIHIEVLQIQQKGHFSIQDSFRNLNLTSVHAKQEKICRCGTSGRGLVVDLALLGIWLDSMILKVYSNLSGSMIRRQNIQQQTRASP